MSQENRSEKLIWNDRLCINGFPELYFCLLESSNRDDLVRGVKYPIKKVLVEMDSNIEIDMNVDINKFYVSAVSCLVAEFGLNKVVQTWNSHSIPGIHLFDQEKKFILLNGNRNLKIKFEFKIRNSI